MKRFLKNNIGILRAYIYWHLFKVVQNTKQNVIRVSEKLFYPVERDLANRVVSLGFFMGVKSNTSCIYTGEVIDKILP